MVNKKLLLRKFNDFKENRSTIANRKGLIILFIVVMITLLFLISGCSDDKVMNNVEVVNYCNTQNITKSCGVEQCILQYSSTFSDNIKLQNERNYYMCKLVECGSNG